MTRKEFIQMCGIFGIGMPVLNSCNSAFQAISLKPSEKVIIIGAGAAGLTAAYLLNQRGIEVQVLEAQSIFGGRMKRTNDFVDFPIPLGAEWLHVNNSIFDEIINDPSVKIDINTKPYNYEQDIAWKDGVEISLKKLGFTIEQKFINSSWFDFFDQYVVPSIKTKIRYSEVVTSIDYARDKVKVQTKAAQYDGDRVIVTVPLAILQEKMIQFIPELPAEKQKAIDSVTVWGGCKAFIEFSDKFYPTAVAFGSPSKESGHKLYYDAAYGQESTKNVLGVIAVGPSADPYLERSHTGLIEYVLADLDEVFEGKASPSYVKHVFQNWNEETYAKGAYVQYFERIKDLRTLGKSVGDRLHFAGDAYTKGIDFSSVQAAVKSAKSLVEDLMVEKE